MVEILSPSTRRFDLTLKRQIYAEMGIPSYWSVDIAVPSVLVLELAVPVREVDREESGRDRGGARSERLNRFERCPSSGCDARAVAT